MYRIFDLFLACFILLLVWPIMLVVSVLLFLLQDGQIFFVQFRPGLYAKPFKLLKFKTMKDLYDDNGVFLADSQRITPIGKFIRSLSLDELPQLFNVIKGDMSLVGPRPLLMEYVSLYSPKQARRHEVRPGITGWAQINGRNATTWDERFRLDLWYVDNHNIGLYFKILFLTFAKLIKRENINHPGHVTMEKFRGNHGTS